MTTWLSSTIVVRGLRLHYTRTRAGGVPLVLAHGIGDDGLCWTMVAEALPPQFDAIMVDARGHGRSSAPEEGYGPASQAEDLAGVIAALDLERPIVLGHSMGALAALVLAGTHPGLPRAILLEDPPPLWMPGAQEPARVHERRAQMRAALAELKRKTQQELVAGQRAASPAWPDAEIRRWAEAKQRLSCNVVAFFDATIEASVEWPGLLRRITCPVLLITGDPALGALAGEESAAALKAFIPQLRVAHVPGAGHSIRRDQFAPYMAAVRAFLDELPASTDS